MDNKMTTKPTVYVTSRIAPSACEALAKAVNAKIRDDRFSLAPEQLLANLQGVDGVVCYLDDKFDAAAIERCSSHLKVIANVAVGYDNIDIDYATRKGILVINTPGVLDNATADLAFGLLIASARRMVESDQLIRTKSWSGWSTDFMLGHDVSGKTLGLIGMGRIGQAMSRRARGFDMKVMYSRKGEEQEKDEHLQESTGAKRVAFEVLLRTADFISIHCPLNEETRGLIGRDQFALMQPSCIVINTARGAVVDESALLEALQQKRIAGAGLDVFVAEPTVPDELINMPNVVLTPHIGSATVETRRAMAELAVNGLITAFSRTMPANLVNKQAWPEFLARLDSHCTESVQ